MKQTTENTSEELSSACRFLNFKVFFGLTQFSPPIIHIKAHQNKQHAASSWFWIAFNGNKNKNNSTSTNHKSRIKWLSAPFQTLHFDIMRWLFDWMLQSANFQTSLGKLNTVHFTVFFLPSNTKGGKAS